MPDTEPRGLRAAILALCDEPFDRLEVEYVEGEVTIVPVVRVLDLRDALAARPAHTGDAETAAAEVLNSHERVSGVRDMRIHCTCGWKSEERVGIRAHRAHVAAVLNDAGLLGDDSGLRGRLAALAEEWERGLAIDDAHPMEPVSRLLRDLRALLDDTAGQGQEVEGC